MLSNALRRCKSSKYFRQNEKPSMKDGFSPSTRTVKSSEVFTDAGSIRQQVPYGIRDYSSKDSQSKSYKGNIQHYHLLSGGSQKII